MVLRQLCSRITYALVVLAALATPALAQERTDELTGDEPSPTGRTPYPADSHGNPSPPLAPRAPRPTSTPATSPQDKPGERAPWAWPWGGPRSPMWTQEWTFAQTHVWMIDVGHIELDTRWDGAVARRSHSVDQLFQAEARVGLLPHIELSVAEDVIWASHDHPRQQGNEIGARFAFWDWGTLPLNPSFEVVWRPRHDSDVDEWEGRASVGMELFPGLELAGDGFFRGQSGGVHTYTWGFHAGATFELVHDVLRVGAEGGVSWQFSPDHQDPFQQTDPEVGPTAIFRPLALVRPEWGNLLKVTAGCQAGLRDDNTNVPLVRAVLIVGCQF